MNEDRIVRSIIKRYGPVIDLREQPSAIIDIIRHFGFGLLDPDGGAPPGGAPPAPKPPPPDPSSMGTIVQLEDLMRVLLKLSRDVARLGAAVQARPATQRSAARKSVAKRRKSATRRK